MCFTKEKPFSLKAAPMSYVYYSDLVDLIMTVCVCKKVVRARAVARSENPRGGRSNVVGIMCHLVEIGLTDLDLQKTPLTTALGAKLIIRRLR